jgi:glycosyltransferase involved in cell wall biosynthesis
MFKNFRAQLNTASMYFNKYGLKATISKIWKTIFLSSSSSSSLEYEIPQFGKKPYRNKISKKTINWFIPGYGKGSGGHLNIFRFIHLLEKLGYKNTIIIIGQDKVSPIIHKNNIKKWFFDIEAKIISYSKDKKIPQAYFAFATSWQTAYYVKSFNGCIKKCYFVQDFEPYFYAVGSEYILAENTYKFGFYGITAGAWLSMKLKADYGMNTSSVSFSIDKDLYKPLPKLKNGGSVKKVFFYARPVTPRRAFEYGIMILNEVYKEFKNVEFILAGWDLQGYKIPFPHKSIGVANIQNLPVIYNKCDAALVLSLTNLSLLPLELMACNVPVISNSGPNVEWLLNKNNSVLAEMDIQSLKNAIIQILENPSLGKKIQNRGYKFSQSTSWFKEAKKIDIFLKKH